jgi:hypothetical protein
MEAKVKEIMHKDFMGLAAVYPFNFSWSQSLAICKIVEQVCILVPIVQPYKV